MTSLYIHACLSDVGLLGRGTTCKCLKLRQLQSLVKKHCLFVLKFLCYPAPVASSKLHNARQNANFFGYLQKSYVYRHVIMSISKNTFGFFNALAIKSNNKLQKKCIDNGNS